MIRNSGVLICLSLSVSMLAATARAQVTTDVTAKLRYEAEGRKIELFGVCDISPKEIIAWDSKGSLSTKIAEQARLMLIASNNDLAFRFGKKNRYVLMQVLKSGYLSFTGPGGSSLQSVSWSNNNGEPGITALRLVADLSDSETEIITTVSTPSPDVITMPLLEGTKWSAKGAEIEINAVRSWKPTPKQQIPGVWNGYRGYGSYETPPAEARSNRWWQIILSMSPSKDLGVPSTFEALDESGHPILYVDSNGNPVSSAKYVASVEASTDPGMSRQWSKKYLAAVFYRGTPSDQIASTITSNIDPKAIKSIRGTTSRQTRIHITGIPLDPK